VPTLIGRWADGKFDTDPVFTLAGLALGMLTGFYGSYTQLREFLAQQRTRQRGDR
jgi:hypothetical protein